MSVLEASGLDIGYGDRAVVHGFDLAIDPGQIVALLGPNGAGKTTTILGLIGELRPLAGSLSIVGNPAAPLHRLARSGVAYVGEERSIFPGLTVSESVRVAGVALSDVFAVFPELERLKDRRAGLLSGGEQQMLVVGTALARKPELLLIDELSLGLAPLVVTRLLAAVRKAADHGVGVLLVEQHIDQALDAADAAVVLNKGAVALRGSADEVRRRLPEVQDLYVATSMTTEEQSQGKVSGK